MDGVFLGLGGFVRDGRKDGLVLIGIPRMGRGDEHWSLRRLEGLRSLSGSIPGRGEDAISSEVGGDDGCLRQTNDEVKQDLQSTIELTIITKEKEKLQVYRLIH